MGKSALMGLGFPEYELHFAVGERVQAGFDEYGDPIYSEPETVTITTKLEQTGRPAIVAMIGVDTAEVPLEGRCLQPRRLPAGVRPGATSPLTIHGVPGVFKLLPWVPSQHSAAVDAVGQKIAGSWTRSG